MEELEDRMLQFFVCDHLPPYLRSISQPFCDLARDLVTWLPDNEERAWALRKLLESKDCAVRAMLEKTSSCEEEEWD